ncbi:unnamed protein product [Parnassius mnemosyne]
MSNIIITFTYTCYLIKSIDIVLIVIAFLRNQLSITVGYSLLVVIIGNQQNLAVYAIKHYEPHCFRWTKYT